MDEQADDIQYFHVSSRIGRVRYLAYSSVLGLVALPILLVASFLTLRHENLMGAAVQLVSDVFIIPIQFTFVIRRLHDMDRSGWLSLIYGAVIPFSLLSPFGLLRGAILSAYLLVLLVNLGFVGMLLFVPGTQGKNNYGPMPPPNSTAVVVGAWSLLAVPFLAGILAAIAIPAYQDFIARSQTSEGIRLAGGAEVGVREYFDINKSWPSDLSTVYSIAGQDPAGRYVATVTGSGAGNTYGVVSTMNTAGVNRMIAGKSLEIWTRDGGNTWHCGPGGTDPLDPKYLPAGCRDDGAP